MKKKLLALGLSAAMILGMTACGSEDAPAKDAGASKESSSVKEESKAEENKPEVKEDPVELRLIMYGEMGPRREEFFENEFHDKVLEELNIDLAVEFLTWGALTGDVQNRLMAGEEFAYMHIPSETDQAARGLCAEISEEDIATYLPAYAEMRGEKGFDCVKVGGKVVAVPMGNKSSSGNLKGLTVQNNILNEVGWDYKDIKTYEDVLEAFSAVQEKYPNMRMLVSPASLCTALDYKIAGRPLFGLQFGLNDTYIMTYLDEDNDKVYSALESEEFKRYCDIAYEMQQLGFAKDDIISDPSAGKNDWAIGNCLAYNGNPGNMVEPGVKAGMPDGTDLQLAVLDDYTRYYDRDYDWAISVSIAAQDDVPDYLRLINWIYESQENYEFSIYGVEGTDWQRNEDGTISKLIDEMMFDDWFLQAFCYHTYDPSISEEAIETYESWDSGSKKSKMAGFVFDSTPVAAEKSALDAVFKEYIGPLRHGYVTYEEGMPKALEELKKAGLDKYVEEYQRQFSEFYANNAK